MSEHGDEIRIPWRVARIVVALLVIIGGLALLSWRYVGLPSNGKPDVKVDQTVLDFGTVPYQTPLQAVFIVRNSGTGTLHIENPPQVVVRAGCCPPGPVLSDTTIPPGGTATVSAEFSMHEGMGGPHDYRIYLRTDDPDTPVEESKILSNWVP